jgi:hypothetical protein
VDAPPEDDGSGEEKPPVIRRFTTEYDPVEDRIRLTLEHGSGRVDRLWLTRRLLVRTVPELVRILDTRLVARDGKRARGDDLSQRRDQMTALGGLKPQAPVRPAPDQDVTDHLITGVGLRLTRRAILLDMKAGDDAPLTVPFAVPHMRQWLAMLNRCFRQAGWDDAVWPDWLKPLPPGEAPPGLRLN